MAGQPESSLDLLERVRAGDQRALDALIARYRPRLVRWASGRLPSYTRDLTETQDLVQETLLSAFRKIAEIEVRDEGSLQAYLRQVLLNRIRTEIRRAGRRPAGVELDSQIEASEASPLECAIGAQALENYERALAALRPDERDLVIARVEFGFTNEEVAREFRKPSANAARMAIQRALLRLTEHMKSHDDSTPA
jgi:RNA polymerase sigma-70 factor (ECF subfamily)